MNKQREGKGDSVKIDISDEDILDAMKNIPGYLDITPGDFRELYKFAYSFMPCHVSGVQSRPETL